ncbi:MAG: sodium:calcium antiporter [Candidatus Levybacteria bacterium]|nr:sodium:calcium antiporter [Candidatus Levybacteria bacterium]
MVLVNLLLFIVAFVSIWLGSGLIVSSVSNFSSKLKLSPFAFSFVFLGLLTSLPEFSVGLQAVASHDAEIFVGNLLGGIIVLFLVIIPLLAIFGNGISLKNDLDSKTTFFTLAVILTPSLFTLDKKVTNLEGGILILLYGILLFVIERKNGIFNRENSKILNISAYSHKDLLKLIVGICVIFISSSIIVDKTVFFADMFNISAFYIGLLVIALGTDLPEMSLAIRSVISGKKDIAMGDYIGAAAASTLMFGIFTLLHNGEVLTSSAFLTTFIFILTALTLFFIFVKSKNFITRKQGILMFAVYIIFIFVEIHG